MFTAERVFAVVAKSSSHSANKKTIWFLRHRCEDTGYYDYKPSDFYLAVTECDSPFENTICDIASNRQIETREFYNINVNSIIDCTKRYNKSEVTLYCRKCDTDFAAHQDHYTVNSNDRPALIVLDTCLYTLELEI
jgi:hypothetical protein